MKLSLSLPSPGHRRATLIRRVVAGCFVVAALVSAVASATQTDPTVLTFARSLPAGTVVADTDLRVTGVPERLIPHGALADTEADAVAGRMTVTEVGQGEVVTELKVTGPRLIDSLTSEFPADSVPTVVPVRLADPTSVALLRHGDTVTIVTTPSENPAGGSEDDEAHRVTGPATDESIVVATGGRVVLADPEHPDTVLVALDEPAAQRVASASLSSALGIVLTNN